MSLKSPNYNNPCDRYLYDELMKKPGNELTEEEYKFFTSMYHMEECACGLDGD